MKSKTLSALAVCLIAGQASAQQSLPVQQFAPAPGGDNNFVTVQGTGVLPSLTPSIGVFFNYAHDPLVIRHVVTGDERSLIEHQVQMDLLAALGLFDFLEIGVAIPLTLYQSSGNQVTNLPGLSVDGFVTGDIRLYPKVSILNDPEGFGLAFLAPVGLPTGSPDNLQGNEGVTVEPRLVLQYAFSRNFRLALSGGFVWRPEDQSLYNIKLGNEITYGVAAEVGLIDKTLSVLAEGYGKYSIESNTQEEERPLEATLALRYWPDISHAITLGAGRGFTDGYGSPDFRAYLGYTFTPKEDPDFDGDGLPNDKDQCPNDPEDFDGFEDTDGCPDPDNDGDGVLDVSDKCPLDPEDKDGFEDGDGCPDPDNDGDGILDVDDKCPNDPEDKDGFQDEDGCPDPDNDGDGILDVNDKCPLEPEDLDGFQDEDGCPDPDNDGDGILDVDDNCPDDTGNTCRVSIKNRCEIQILDQVHFKYNSDQIDERKSAPVLDAVADILVRNAWIKLIEIQGHTDSDGPDDYNLDLSQRRTNSVMAYIANKGVEQGRLTAKGYGETRPIDNNRTAKGRAANRRVQFIILDPSQDSCKQ